MKIKKEYIILGVIIIILSLYLFQRRMDRTLYELPQIPELAGKNISKIEITRPGDILVLTRKDENWYMGSQEYRVDKNKVTDILEVVENLTLTALVSESKDYIRYDLNDKKKISVKAWSGDTLGREFEIGKTTTSSKLTFVKIAGNERVFHAQSNFRNKFDKPIDDMRDKSVLSFNAADIQEIHITKESESISFTRIKSPLQMDSPGETKDSQQTPVESEMVWQDSKGQKGDELKINKIISTLSNLKCQEYIQGKTKTEFSDPNYHILLKGTKDYTISIFSELKENSGKGRPAFSSEIKDPFFLNQWSVKNLVPDFKDLVKAP